MPDPFTQNGNVTIAFQRLVIKDYGKLRDSSMQEDGSCLKSIPEFMNDHHS
jgi:hypothetical protein